MKRTVTLAAAALLVASAALAETNVLSQNAVGYIKVAITNSDWHLVGSQFDSLEGGASTIGDLLGTNVPNATQAYIFDASESRYIGEQFVAAFGGWTPGTNHIDRGDGIWVKTPSAHDFLLMGEVPALATNSMSFLEGFQIITYPYPVETSLTNSVLNDIAADGDLIYVYDGGYVGYQYISAFGGWTPNNLILKPGMAFWYKSSAGKDWKEPKPYDWP